MLLLIQTISGDYMGSLGSETPRVFTPPLRDLIDGPKGTRTSWGFDVIWFAREILGMPYNPYQEWLAIHALELLPREKVIELYPAKPELWDEEIPRFKTILVLIARQNGKTHWAKVLIMWALFRHRLDYVLGAAQTKKDAHDLWSEIVDYVEDHPRLKKRLKKIVTAHGFEELKVKSGGVYKVAGLNRKDGRGKTVNVLYMDELREHHNWLGWNALSSTTKSPVVGINICTTNAGSDDSVVLNKLQDDATLAIENGETDSASVGLFEWSAHPDRAIDDREGWAEANPDLGHGRLTERDIAADLEAMEEAGFRTEVLCQRVRTLEKGKLDPIKWAAIADPDSHKAPTAQVHVGIDVAIETGTATGRAYIYGAAEREDGLIHVEHIITFESYYLAVDWLQEQLGAEWFDGKVGIQITGAPSSHLAKLLESTDLEIIPWQGVDMSSSCLGYYTAINEQKVRWLGDDADNLLHKSALGVRDQPRADTWIWSRQRSLEDSSPFIATNIAWFMATRRDDSPVSAYSEPYWDEEDFESDVPSTSTVESDSGFSF